MRSALVLVTCLGVVACAEDGDTVAIDPDGGGGGSFSIRVTNVGVECSVENICGGAGSTCMLVSSTNTRYPGGYCTATCEASAQCGPGAVCPVGEALLQDPNFPTLGVWPKSCFRSCKKDAAPEAGCRSGYVCRSLAEVYRLTGAIPPAMHELVCIPDPAARHKVQ